MSAAPNSKYVEISQVEQTFKTDKGLHLPWLTSFDNVHLAVERVFGAAENKTQRMAGTMPRWRWWASPPRRRSGPARSPAA